MLSEVVQHNVKIFWMILAGICIVVAAIFLLRGDLNTAFVAAALGLVAWFLNHRIEMKGIVTAADLEQSRRERMEGGEDSDED